MNSDRNDAPQGGATAPRPALGARDRARMRKTIYTVAIIFLVIGLYALSNPSTVSTPQAKGQPGGVLSRFRDEHQLGQAELGEIDPTSETIRLATLGLRGVASSMLWASANEFQKKKDWTQLRAALDQISKLQPHSVLVWRYQSWNLSYNVSVAFDDYHEKFYWVIEGLNFMLKGVQVNDKEPRLCWDMGWFISNKIGKADDAKYYRRLFAGKREPSESFADFRRGAGDADEASLGGDYAPDFVKEFREKCTPPSGYPHGSDVRDNWHVGKAWFLAAESKINPPRYPVRGMADVIFYSDAPTCQFYYADALEKDGRFDQVARNAWRQATREWHEFGERDIDTSYDIKLKLNRKEELDDLARKGIAALDKLAPGVRQELRKEKYDRLTPEERQAWDEAPEKRTEKQNMLIFQNQVESRMEIRHSEVASRAPQAVRKQAVKLAREIEGNEELSVYTNRERSKVNFDFWKTRALAEQTTECLKARKAVYDGDAAFAKGDQIAAGPLYDAGILGWSEVLKKFPLLVDDPSLGGDLVDVIRRYRKYLDQDDKNLPENFPLQHILDKHQRN